MRNIHTIGFLSIAIGAMAILSCEGPLSGSDSSQGANADAAFTLSQTTSDAAQKTTLAFSALAMMTGNLASQTFFPPGKVADYTGFQYLRDNDPDGMGHNTSFLTRVAYNVLYILSEAQLASLAELASAQAADVELYALKRYPLMKAFRRLLDGDLPAGTTGLSRSAVMAASRELYLLDGQIAFDRAALYAALLRSMTEDQLSYLDAMKGKGWASWPDIQKADIDLKLKSLPQASSVAVMTYAGDLFSWYAGSVEADVYFCPERQGTYFGSFYMKDAPAIGHEGYSIDTEMTATAGSALCDASLGYVSETQAALVSGLVDTQRQNLYASATDSIVAVRTAIATLLRSLLAGSVSASSIESQVLALSGTYGELDGENNYHYATAFAQLYESLSAGQKAQLASLRASLMTGTYADGTDFDFSTCTTWYLFSAPVSDTSLLDPYVNGSTALFSATGE